MQVFFSFFLLEASEEVPEAHSVKHGVTSSLFQCCVPLDSVGRCRRSHWRSVQLYTCSDIDMLGLNFSCPLLAVLHIRSVSTAQAVSNNKFPYAKKTPPKTTSRALAALWFKLSLDFHVPMNSLITQFL